MFDCVWLNSNKLNPWIELDWVRLKIRSILFDCQRRDKVSSFRFKFNKILREKFSCLLNYTQLKCYCNGRKSVLTMEQELKDYKKIESVSWELTFVKLVSCQKAQEQKILVVDRYCGDSGIRRHFQVGFLLTEWFALSISFRSFCLPSNTGFSLNKRPRTCVFGSYYVCAFPFSL